MQKKMIVNISFFFETMAHCFANSACMGKFYEPLLPEELRK